MGMLVNHIIPILVSPNIKANEMEKYVQIVTQRRGFIQQRIRCTKIKKI